MKKSYRLILATAIVASTVVVSTVVRANPPNDIVFAPVVPPTDLTDVSRPSGDAMRSPRTGVWTGKGQLSFVESFEGTPPVPVMRVSLSYRINIADLDLASQDGPLALEKRVKDAAKAVCEELAQKYPQMTPSDEVCAKAAVDGAMVKARQLVAKAREKLPHQLSSTALRPEAGRGPTSTVIAAGQ